MKKRLTLKLAGKVQGVFFRAHTEDVVNQINNTEDPKKDPITGYVKNEPNGSLQVVMEGEQDRLEQARSSIQEGPSSASVEEVYEEWGNYSGEFDEFKIQY